MAETDVEQGLNGQRRAGKRRGLSTLSVGGSSGPDCYEEGVILFVCLGNRVKRFVFHGGSKGTLAVQLEKLFLGTRSADLSDPLDSKNLYLRHREHGVYYQNWKAGSLVSGDVLLIRGHESFFDLANAGYKQPFVDHTHLAQKNELSQGAFSKASFSFSAFKSGRQPSGHQGTTVIASPEEAARRLSDVRSGENAYALVEGVPAWKRHAWSFLTDPKSSWAATIWAIFIAACIMISIAEHISESAPRFRTEEAAETFEVIDIGTSIIFAVELTARLLLCPSYRLFVRDVYNYIDIVSLFPAFLALFIPDSENMWLNVVRVLRLIRMFRFLAFCRTPLDLIGATFVDALTPLTTIIFLIVLLSAAMSAVMYAVEAGELDNLTHLHKVLAGYICDLQMRAEVEAVTGIVRAKTNLTHNCDFLRWVVPGEALFRCQVAYDLNKQCTPEYTLTPFQSLPHAGWWAVQTMTTVGYGDMVPTTVAGHLVGYFTMIGGVMAVALPISIIATSLSQSLQLQRQ